MKATGIIVEYNPLHNGHLHHIKETLKITKPDVLIAVMSGNYVQRGEFAIVDKFQRARSAIEHGVDIVIELPYIYATQSAQQFACASVDLLHLAQVNSIVFGSESNDLETLQEIAEMSFKVDYLKEALSAGEGYAKAFSLGSSVLQSNDILAVAYLKALQDKNIQPYTIQRTTHYHDPHLQQGISSATAIRKAYFNQEDISNDCAMLINEPTVHWQHFFPYLKILFTTLDVNYMKEIFLFNEGIENHLRNMILKSQSWQEFIDMSATKRYTKARIQRCCLQLINHITKKDVTNLGPLDTLRILAFNEKGQQYLKHLKKQEVKIASKFAQVPLPYREMELKTTKLYSTLMSQSDAKKIIEAEIAGAIRIV